jgi:hypothetical protein
VKKSWLTRAGILAPLLLLLLVVSAPARLLHLFVPADQVLLQGLEGTVWRGTASSVQLRLPQGFFHLGQVQWSLRPLSLITLSPRVSLESKWGSQSLAGEVALRGARDLDVDELELQFNATLLTNFAPVALDGFFNLQLAELKIREGLPHSAEGRLVWQGAAWRSPRGLVPLGTYAIDFLQPAGEILRGEVVTLTGPLTASGFAELEGRRYAVDILMGSEEELDPQLQQMLSLIAAPEGGDYRVGVSGDF